MEHRRGGHNLSTSWPAEILLYFTSKRSRFMADSVNPQWVRLGHNKMPMQAPPGVDSDISTGPILANASTFSTVPPCFDWAVARRWMTVCDNEHNTCHREIGAGKLPTSFRLIDVQSESLVDAPVEQYPSFVSLSYVWGAEPSHSITTRRDNLALLKQPGSLSDLPRTVRDAMEVCKRLGERYLWVDRLCIVQDDKKDKYGQIRSLEAIYSRATLVIVAACGDSIQSGLTGISDSCPREPYQLPTSIFGFTLSNKLSGFDKAIRTTWNERGWTYQEAVLARRKLYFTRAEIWFECAERLQRENTWSTSRRSIRDIGNRLRVHDDSRTGTTHDDYEEYGRHLENYSRRALTYPSDVYYAFHGIEDAFYPKNRTIFGLPESDFTRSLLWYPYDWPFLEERELCDENLTLPSWSWASLVGHVATCHLYGSKDNRLFQRGSFYCSLCEWSACDEDSSQQQRIRKINSANDDKVWKQLDEMWAEQDPAETSHFDSFHDVPDYRQFLALAWVNGCVEADVPNDLLEFTSDSAASAERLAARWPTVGAFWAEVRHRTRHPQVPLIPHQLRPGYIVTRTQSTTLSVKHDGQEEFLRGDIYIPNAHFTICDTRGDGAVIGALLSTVEFRLRGTVAPDQAVDVDFIALAVGAIPFCVSQKVSEESLRVNCFHKDRRQDLLLFGQPGVLVMAVRWDGEVARRVSLGWVTLRGWADSKPSSRTVVLA
ncbi:hypothetical protein NPX13_g1027 [Xylaria arbuscula]|uniref:Heterokaryon incompatibility domain-containing protein n=1 Tax=Xylaria arbuscula TaxID=114810 RepID=A0A9W8TRK0_9PEZI|nr:hypothetical protein NPX13_g1027 [Xylaria arbuscula]